MTAPPETTAVGAQPGAVPPGWEATASTIYRLLSEQLVATGVQVWASVEGRCVLDAAAGDAATGPMRTDTVHSTFCLSKPLLALAAAHAVHEGAFSFDSRLADLGVGTGAAPLAACTVRDVVNHAAGLGWPTAMEYRMHAPSTRTSMLDGAVARGGPRSEYSEIAGGLLLEQLIETHLRRSAAEVIRCELLDPLGVSTDVATDGDTARVLRDAGRYSVPIGGLPESWYPMVSEVLDVELDSIRPAFGVAWTMRAAGMVVDVCAAAARGARGMLDRFAVDDMFAAPAAPFHDRNVGRTLQYSGSFLVGAAAHDVASRFGDALATVSGVLPSAVVADLERAVTVAVLLNGAETDPALSRLERAALLNAVHDDITSGGVT